jgi:glutamate--cysteine ligase
MSNIIQIIASAIRKNQDNLLNFFTQKFHNNSEIFYSSLDVRRSSFKIAPVDANCFPAGFNNLSKQGLCEAKKVLDIFFSQQQDYSKILIITENHSRNTHYFENLAVLEHLLSAYGQVYMANWQLQQEQNFTVTLPNLALEKNLNIWPLLVIDNFLTIPALNFTPNLVILNNDLTAGLPKILTNIQQSIVPSQNLGWYQRSKNNHFNHYNLLAQQVAEILNIDAWLFSTYHDFAINVDFKHKLGLKDLAKKTEVLLNKIKQKYQQYNINEQPYCYLKADNGTYGMAVWSVFEPEEILHINKKERNKMHMLKNSVENHTIILQEGVITADFVDSAPSEIVLYLMCGKIIDSFLRINKNRNSNNSLNAVGSEFLSLLQLPKQHFLQQNDSDLNLVTKLIAQISSLAITYE